MRHMQSKCEFKTFHDMGTVARWCGPALPICVIFYPGVDYTISQLQTGGKVNPDDCPEARTHAGSLLHNVFSLVHNLTWHVSPLLADTMAQTKLYCTCICAPWSKETPYH